MECRILVVLRIGWPREQVVPIVLIRLMLARDLNDEGIGASAFPNQDRMLENRNGNGVASITRCWHLNGLLNNGIYISPRVLFECRCFLAF
ncbi:Hypothetical protein NTJ_13036 [Nesidiocoris tenuis]|uniref:Secreted protein n=1 Tax=Nesidiocoris tenuis TaxID=355587 RepID=A0ABN7B8Q1_9HEMI|nr:Hypothetical protein NTJ_13036 [Nesidiocoris tenuis]